MYFTVQKYTTYSSLVNQQNITRSRELIDEYRIAVSGRRPTTPVQQIIHKGCKKYAQSIGREVEQVGRSAWDKPLVILVR